MKDKQKSTPAEADADLHLKNPSNMLTTHNFYSPILDQSLSKELLVDLSHQNSNTFTKFVNALNNLRIKSTEVDSNTISKSKLKHNNTTTQDAITKPATEEVSLISTKPTRSINEYGETEIQKKIQHQKNLSKQEIDEIILKYSQGASTYALAKEYGCHRYTISHALKGVGIEVTNRKARKEELVGLVIQLYSEWYKPSEIGEALGVSADSVRRILKENNIELRKSWEYRERDVSKKELSY